MKLSFYKYQGTGNDFIVIDDRSEAFPAERKDIVSFLCNRKMGIGADGLILIQKHPHLDFRMVFLNPDGSRSLCGNGSRCAIAFARHLGIIGEQTTFETTDGIHDAYIKEEIIYFHLHDVDAVTRKGDDFFIDTGSPHHIHIVDNLDTMDVVAEGRVIRYHDEYSPSGTNANFIEKHPDKIRVRTYERGVEDETLSCGTGVTACALAAGIMGYKSPVKIETKGGDLTVSFNQVGKQSFRDIYLAGPGKKVYEGSIDLHL